MSDNARILWRIAVDSPPLRVEQFHGLGQHLSECHAVKTATESDGRTVLQLRFQKRVRSTPLVESLRKLLSDGTVHSAWIEKQGGAERIELFDGTRVELEPIEAKQKKRRGTEQPSDDDTTTTIEAVLSSIDELENRHRAAIDALRRQVLRLRNKRPDHAPQPQPAPTRPPIRVSFLRSATVTELYYAGVWLPNHDVDNTLVPPRRECRFRSELTDDAYIENYDIDDVLQPDRASPHLTDKASALEHTGFLHFTDQPRARPAVLLHALRHAPFDVLVLLRVLRPDHDINDEGPTPPPNRERHTRTQICERLGLNPHHSGYKAHFVRGYDIDDVDGKREADEIRAKALVWKELHREMMMTGPSVRSVAAGNRQAESSHNADL